jgi:hypothetical protein
MLFGRSLQLKVRSELGQETTVTMRIPLQTRLEVVARSLKTMARRLRRLSSAPASNYEKARKKVIIKS